MRSACGSAIRAHNQGFCLAGRTCSYNRRRADGQHTVRVRCTPKQNAGPHLPRALPEIESRAGRPRKENVVSKYTTLRSLSREPKHSLWNIQLSKRLKLTGMSRRSYTPLIAWCRMRRQTRSRRKHKKDRQAQMLAWAEADIDAGTGAEGYQQSRVPLGWFALP